MSSAMDTLLIVGLAIAGPFVFIGFWMGVCWLLALMGGWTGLAKRYRTSAESPFGAETTSAMLGLVSYRGVLEVGFAEDGVDLRVMMLFRAGHAPLRIPWAEIHFEGEKQILFGRVAMLRLGQGGPLLRVPAELWARGQGVR